VIKLLQGCFDSRIIHFAMLIFTDLDGLPSSSRPYEPPSFRQGFKSSDGLKPDLTVSGKHSSAVEPVNSQSSTSSTSECIAANSIASAPGLSPSSSMGSLTSEKSTLNPNAKVWLSESCFHIFLCLLNILCFLCS
jgi:hypothetical protein